MQCHKRILKRSCSCKFQWWTCSWKYADATERASASRRHRLPDEETNGHGMIWHYWELNCGNTSAVEGRSVQDHTGQSRPWGSQHVLCECHLRVCQHECNVTSVFWSVAVHANFNGELVHGNMLMLLKGQVLQEDTDSQMRKQMDMAWYGTTENSTVVILLRLRVVLCKITLDNLGREVHNMFCVNVTLEFVSMNAMSQAYSEA